MMVETSIKQIRCDGCNNVLTPTSAFTSSGVFKYNYISKGKIDICPACAFEIMALHVVADMPSELLTKYLSEVHVPFSSGNRTFIPV